MDTQLGELLDDWTFDPVYELAQLDIACYKEYENEIQQEETQQDARCERHLQEQATTS